VTTALVPYRPPAPLQIVEGGETVNVNAGLAGLSIHSQRAYKRWIAAYLAAINPACTACASTSGPGSRVNQIEDPVFDFDALDLDLAIRSLGTAPLKIWLGGLKARKLGKQSISQAKAAVVWLAQFLADLGRTPYWLPAAMSKVKPPRAEDGQRPGKWLSLEQMRCLIQALDCSPSPNVAILARNKAILVLLIVTGLRCDEIVTVLWSDLTTDSGRPVLRVHGKGEKLRVVKLPSIAVQAIGDWRAYHPSPDGKMPIFTHTWKGGRVTLDAINRQAIWLIVMAAAKAARLGRLSPHDLRRSFARGAYEAGAGLELIRQVLGHSNIVTTERYVNARLELDEAATDIYAAALLQSGVGQ
jgi:integrase